jgi:hypothetical protein
LIRSDGAAHVVGDPTEMLGQCGDGVGQAGQRLRDLSAGSASIWRRSQWLSSIENSAAIGIESRCDRGQSGRVK